MITLTMSRISTLMLRCTSVALPALLLAAQAQAGLQISPSSVQGACSPTERWQISEAVPATAHSEFTRLLGKQAIPARGFSSGLALRAAATSDESRIFAEYWISRSLLKAGLTNAAWDGFKAIAAYTPSPRTAGVQVGAVECLNRIYATHPGLELDQDFGAHLTALAPFAPKPLIQSAALNQLKASISAQAVAGFRASTVDQDLLTLLKDSGPFEAFAYGIRAAQAGDTRQTIIQFEKLLNQSAPSLPEPLKKETNFARMLLGRAHYAEGHYELAQAQYRLLDRDTNELPAMLSELAWSSLKAGRSGEAIGSAINLESGRLKTTFEPEAPMVMAMALNELCQYPSSLKAIEGFRRDYKGAHEWLRQWLSQPTATRPPLYPMATAYLTAKKTAAGIPERVASEWTRSSLFIADQEAITRSFKQVELADETTRSGSFETQKLGEEIRTEAHALTLLIRKEKSLQKTYKPGLESLTPTLQARILHLKGQVLAYQALRHAGPQWRQLITARGQMELGARKARVARIDRELAARNERMLTKLDQVAETNELIEAEIFQGAGHDIIWQHAHPDYKALAEKMKNDSDERNDGPVWDWGRAVAGSNEGMEIWDDELGNFKAGLFDNCSSKDKYLALRSK